MSDRGPTVINTGGGGGGGGWMIAALLAVVIIVGGLWLFGGLNFGGSDGDVDVSLDTPDVNVEETVDVPDAPDVDVDVPEVDAPDAGAEQPAE